MSSGDINALVSISDDTSPKEGRIVQLKAYDDTNIIKLKVQTMPYVKDKLTTGAIIQLSAKVGDKWHKLVTDDDWKNILQKYDENKIPRMHEKLLSTKAHLLDHLFSFNREKELLALRGLQELSYNQFVMSVMDDDSVVSSALIHKILRTNDEVLLLEIFNIFWCMSVAGKVIEFLLYDLCCIIIYTYIYIYSSLCVH